MKTILENIDRVEYRDNQLQAVLDNLSDSVKRLREMGEVETAFYVLPLFDMIQNLATKNMRRLAELRTKAASERVKEQEAMAREAERLQE
jgi:hypothetical protein